MEFWDGFDLGYELGFEDGSWEGYLYAIKSMRKQRFKRDMLILCGSVVLTLSISLIGQKIINKHNLKKTIEKNQ